MAAGKTSVGRHLARELGIDFVDTDELIVARNGPIPELFARVGEAGFRTAEYAAVREALDLPPCVLALGGGAVTHAPTLALVAERALRVYLEVPVDTLVARLRRSRTVRPIVGRAPTADRVRELLAPREPFYRASDIVVCGPHRSRAAFAKAIASRIEAYECARRPASNSGPQ